MYPRYGTVHEGFDALGGGAAAGGNARGGRESVGGAAARASVVIKATGSRYGPAELFITGAHTMRRFDAAATRSARQP